MTHLPKIIGLTGNIATGKSVLRRMLTNAGGLGIDSDLVAHRMLYRDGPAYTPVIRTFGDDILTEERQISRARLGAIVFSDPQKLAQLEALIHPAVTQAIQARIRKTDCPFVAIEAIKLFEANLAEICDSVWVSHVPMTHQVERLMQTRQMTKEDALSRISAQPPQSEKLSRANVVIHTAGTFKTTWQQIQTALHDTIQLNAKESLADINKLGDAHLISAADLPPTELEGFWQAQERSLYECLGMQMVLPLITSTRLSALALWDNWHFTAALKETLPTRLAPALTDQILPLFERHAKRKQCELLLLPKNLPDQFGLDPRALGFTLQSPDQLNYPAWQQAAERMQPTQDPQVWVKTIAQPLEKDINIKDN